MVTALVRPIGGYLERVFSGTPTALARIMVPLERIIYRLTRVDRHAEMTAAEHTPPLFYFERWNGTLVTTMFGRKSSAPLMSSDVWLCSRCCHHRAGTNSGRMTVT